jgi:hypothetical protein
MGFCGFAYTRERKIEVASTAVATGVNWRKSSARLKRFLRIQGPALVTSCSVQPHLNPLHRRADTANLFMTPFIYFIK